MNQRLLIPLLVAALLLALGAAAAACDNVDDEDSAPEDGTTEPTVAESGDPFEELGLAHFDEIAKQRGMSHACEQAINWLIVEGDLLASQSYFSEADNHDAEQLRRISLELAVVREAERWLDRHGAEC